MSAFFHNRNGYTQRIGPGRKGHKVLNYINVKTFGPKEALKSVLRSSQSGKEEGMRVWPGFLWFNFLLFYFVKCLHAC